LRPAPPSRSPRETFLGFQPPALGEEEIAAVAETLRSGWLTTGPRTAELEQRFADYAGAEHAVAVSSGTAAMHLSLLALGVGPGDEVITTPITWPATANVIVHTGATPVFADVREADLNIDPERAAALVGPRTKAILPVHLAGQPADLDPISKLGLPVVEDAACALAATWHGRRAGTWGVMGCFSFHPRKAITTGEGGMITTNNPEIARRLRALRNHGQDPDASTPDFVIPGFNNRMTDFQGALGVSQMTISNDLRRFNAVLLRRPGK
jgi:dTDP-4-amino-4,6-dideoxygalactose transaminase